MKTLVGNKEVKYIKDLIGNQICIFKINNFDFSKPAERIEGKLVDLKWRNGSCTLKAVINTTDGQKIINVCPIDKYADLCGVWTPVTNNIYGEKVELQFINEKTFLKK